MSNATWFDEARYGMFIHSGAYSVAALGEWAANRERIPFEEYTRLYAENFRAENYDPASWAALAKEAGMGYAVLTTRGSNVYLHIWNSTGTELCFAAMKNRVLSARFLDGGAPVAFEQKDNRLLFRGLPVPLPDSIATAIIL